MIDERYIATKERLSNLSIEQIHRITDNIDKVCFDTFNYNSEDNTYCPLAIALNLHESVLNPTDEKIQTEISKLFTPVNILKGTNGIFYTLNRRRDLINLCSEIIKEKTFS